jgi:hypothetical protein
MSQSSEVSAITLCVAYSTSVCCCKRIFRYRLSPETFGYTVVDFFFGLRYGVLSVTLWDRTRNFIRSSGGSPDGYRLRWWCDLWTLCGHLIIPLSAFLLDRPDASAFPYWGWCGNYQALFMFLLHFSLSPEDAKDSDVLCLSHIFRVSRCCGLSVFDVSCHSNTRTRTNYSPYTMQIYFPSH